ncbi:hypothetical protein CARUB_v10019570mg [Capsella rubella]|uniref:MATH domain-containing protein n=1 Tax=Capsella rubella TaxID=81985 RepID=R0FTF8_9BRAS|nr:hypothetical protein CARUB_v10019570mg [Capsella rubella]
MADQGGYKRFGWVIKDMQFLIGDSKWRLVAHPTGIYSGYFSLFLEVAPGLLPLRWRRYVDYRFTLVNHLSETYSIHKRGWHWFDKDAVIWGFRDMIPVISLIALNSGFLLNGELLIIAEVDVLEVTDTLSTPLYVAEISDNNEQRTPDDSSSSEDLQNKDDVTIEVNGFQVLSSQVDQVKAIFEKHPDLTWDFSLKNQQIKNAYMNALLELIKTLCKSSKELTVEDLKKADNTLSDLTKAGLNLNWLRKKLDQALEKQIEYDTRIRELEKHVKKRKLALAEVEADLEKEKAAASASLMSFD